MTGRAPVTEVADGGPVGRVVWGNEERTGIGAHANLPTSSVARAEVGTGRQRRRRQGVKPWSCAGC